MADFLMCPPEFYGIEYEINPWMNRQRNADQATATRQWNDLKIVLEQAGACIHTMVPVQGLPDMVFTANAALVYRKRAVMSRFRPTERRPETVHSSAWFHNEGFELYKLDERLCFEGAGDALFCGDRLWAGYRMRSDAIAQQTIGAELDVQVTPMELIDPQYYHLDTCFCPRAADVAMYFPGAFDAYGRKVLNESLSTLVEIGEDEARRFAANAVVVDGTVITNTGCPRLRRALRAEGFEPLETPLCEFVKAGGSAKCLTLRLDGEDAANWE